MVLVGKPGGAYFSGLRKTANQDHFDVGQRGLSF